MPESSQKSKRTLGKPNSEEITHLPPSPVNEQDAAILEQQPLLDHNHEFLDPDDPIVSPLNLYNVQLMKIGVTVLIFFNAIVGFALILTDFISIPGLNNRGKSFLELDLILVALLTNAITLWCFTVPVYYDRILGYITGGLLLLDLLVIGVVTYTRHQFGWIGIIILIWTGLNVLVNALVDYWVEREKRVQEVRYTGRVEKRWSLSELLIALVKITVKLFLLWVVWCISLTFWLQTFDSHEKPWGKMVAVNDNSFKVHLACFGNVHNNTKSSQPIILVEGGQMIATEVFQEWIEELYHLNKIDRYCIWDRPGYGFSDSAPSPVSIGIITEYLIEALNKEEIEGPFSLVGFDIGGLYSRVFASRNPNKVHSLLLVDSWHEDLLKRWPFSGSNRKNEKSTVFKNIIELMDNITGFKLWFRGLVSPLGIVSNIHWFLHPFKHSSKSRIFGSDMRYQPKYIRARLQEQITSTLLSYSEVKESTVHDLPLSVISSGFMIKNSLNWGKWQQEISKISSNTVEWVIAENSNHEIWKSPRGREQLQQLLMRVIGGKTY
ncbi:predicted protein [Scheffersomyces stipitis CBS 6054]|uniref:AB hydrolase-1 domain-containing protein n=1 Tax=Scheffersomyces stipitis (strain ATCC 58785 / CBS 6054 / NBRC 10063 / NRRL Y-11545) TaxID=322104 RepID=A3LUQ4_PICST|nr:predicted protein [Scheffersomyces stipitis CBS 6054]ABN67001.2 predicted protein [Scheffersomyces stipitis CBS 6054]KAG2731328.1 hypothetical protein G9P44_005744 [Scheffersomyces stipitis]